MRALITLLLISAPATAEVTASSPDGFISRSEAVIAKPPAEVWATLVNWGLWWDPAHSYSGKPGALSLDARSGGQLAENWADGSVLHATVLAAMPLRLLRLSGGFGPLQSLPASAILSFQLKPEGSSTRLTMTYAAGGPAHLKLDALARPVDAVMVAGFERLVQAATLGTQTPR